MTAAAEGPTRRLGAILACGCWTWWGVMPGQAVGELADCDLGIGQKGARSEHSHGKQRIVQANVDGPLNPEICEPGKSPTGYHTDAWYEQDVPCEWCGLRDLNVWVDGVQQVAEDTPQADKEKP